jgi:hypothetical protein
VLEAAIDADPRAQFPGKLPELPAFITGANLPPPVLAGSEHTLPPVAVERLLMLLALTDAETPHPGIAEVAAACTPASLSAFAWELFTAWLLAGAPAKEQWAFRALGHLGDDECARRLAPMLRQWPGEGGHARAVLGLEILEGIGTDLALMLLDGIAQRSRYKGLQEQARARIAGVAEKRELTPEALEDRLVPDLGLDASGQLALDFGPRRFTVGFDELLRPFVRDQAGKRLGELPRPNKADDPDKAEAAQATWKALKADARLVAAHQVRRLEQAMCTRRRWRHDEFTTLLLGHPLLGHLVRRLLWGAFAGDRLVQVFRVAEDGSLADPEDAAVALAEGTHVGLVHALELEPGLAARFGQVLADYEIQQPFPQLGRDTHALTAEELASRRIARHEGVVIEGGRLFGLEHHGWRRGSPQDAGAIYWFEKPLAPGVLARLSFEPGWAVGYLNEVGEQTLESVVIEGLDDDARLDPVTASELLRDLQRLRGDA